MSEKIIAYKATDKDMKCRGKQYEVGKTYHEEKANCCHAGMHACTLPLEVLRYYPLKGSPRFFEVECGGDVSRSCEGSKLACTELTVKGELNLTGLIKATVGAIFKRAEKKNTTSGWSSSAVASGKSSSAATLRGSSSAVASGEYSSAVASGEYTSAVASGGSSSAVASGGSSSAVASGESSSAATSGWSSSAVASGESSSAATSGEYSSAVASGQYSSAATSGWASSAVATGRFSRAEVLKKDSIAIANGYDSRVRGVVGSWLVLTEYSTDGDLVCVDLKYVDGTNIKADTWYKLCDGVLMEAQP